MNSSAMAADDVEIREVELPYIAIRAQAYLATVAQRARDVQRRFPEREFDSLVGVAAEGERGGLPGQAQFDRPAIVALPGVNAEQFRAHFLNEEIGVRDWRRRRRAND